MSSNASRITRTVAGVLIAAGLAAGAAAPADAAHVDHGHALLPRHVTRPHPIARRGGLVLATARIRCDCMRIHPLAGLGDRGPRHGEHRAAPRPALGATRAVPALRRAPRPAATRGRIAHARTLHAYDAIIAYVVALRAHLILIDRPGMGVRFR